MRQAGGHYQKPSCTAPPSLESSHIGIFWHAQRASPERRHALAAGVRLAGGVRRPMALAAAVPAGRPPGAGARPAATGAPQPSPACLLWKMPDSCSSVFSRSGCAWWPKRSTCGRLAEGTDGGRVGKQADRRAAGRHRQIAAPGTEAAAARGRAPAPHLAIHLQLDLRLRRRSGKGAGLASRSPNSARWWPALHAGTRADSPPQVPLLAARLVHARDVGAQDVLRLALNKVNLGRRKVEKSAGSSET